VLRKIETPAIFRFVDSILAGRAIELYNFGHLRRDFTFVEDIVEGIVSVLALPPRGGSAQGRGSQAPMHLCNMENQQPVELLHVVHTIERCLRNPCLRGQAERGYGIIARASQSMRAYKGLWTVISMSTSH
jgi:nucleoside-diphosphate-sugar epimerase